MLLAGCRGDAPAAPAVGADPALWVVRDADTTIYLFGTIHVLKPGLGWFDEAVRDAFDASDTLVLETLLPGDAEMAALVRDLGALPPGAPGLRSRIPASLAQETGAALAEFGRAPDSLDRSEPWLAAMLLASLSAERLGYARENGVEAALRHAAEEDGKELVGLETPRMQLGYFDRLSPPAQLALLREAASGAHRSGEAIDTMVAAWAAGDAERLARLVNQDVTVAPELAETLLRERNRRWADWIARRMQTPGTVFIAVGAGHLAGKDGVQAGLAARGFTAERIAY